MSFLSEMRNARDLAAREQLAFSQENDRLDAVSREFYSNEIGVAVSDLRDEVKKLYEGGQIDEATFSNFGFIGGGRAGATYDELSAIAELKFPEGTENYAEERDYYVTDYLNRTGAAAAHLGNNKAYSAMNREGQFLTPEVMTWDNQTQSQTYNAPMTMGGVPAEAGGEPASMDINRFNRWLLNYQESIQRQAGKPISYGRAVAWLSADEPGGTYPPPPNMGAGGAGTYPGGDNVIERTNRDVEAGAIPAVPGAGGGLSGAAGSTQTVSLDDAADGVPSQVHDYGIMDSSMTEILDTAQLDLAFGGGARSARVGAARRIADRVQDADSQYTHDRTSDIHLGANPDQWNSRTSTQQQDLTAQSIRISNENIATGMYSGPVENGVNLSNLEHLTSHLDSYTTSPEGTLGHGTGGPEEVFSNIGTRLARWERTYGPLDEIGGMNKIDTLRTVRDFYATPEGDPPDPEVGGTGARTVEQTLQRFPEYYEEFKQLGAVEFAGKYYDDPDFLSHIPTLEKQEADIAQAEDILVDVEKAYNVTVTPDGDIQTADRGVITSPGGALPRQAGEMLSIQDIRLAEELQITTPEQSAVANTIAVLTQGDNADRALAVSDIAHIPRRIRRVFAAMAYADLPENERQRLLPVLNALAEYGILDTRLARIPTPYEAASAINQAYSNDISMIRTQGAEFELFENMRRAQIDRVIRMGQLALDERGQNIMARGQEYDQWWRARQARWNNDSVVREQYENLEEASNAALQWGLDSSAEFDALPLTPNMQEEFGAQGNVLSPFTALRGEFDLKKVHDDIFSNQYGAALQVLARRVSRAPNMASLAHMEPDIQAAVHNIFRGMSSEHFRLDIVGGIQGGLAASLGTTAATGGVGIIATPAAFVGGFVLMQYDEAYAAWKQAYFGGAGTESFNTNGRFIAIGEDNLPIRDMSEVWNAKTGYGTKIKSFRMLGAMGQEEGQDINPNVINKVFGTDLMDVMLASAVFNANEFR